MARQLAHGAACARHGDGVDTRRKVWARWGRHWVASCHGCGRGDREVRGTRPDFAFCFPCFLAGLVYVERGR